LSSFIPFRAHFLFLSHSLLISTTEIIHILCMTGATWVVLVPTVSRGIQWTIEYYWPPSLIKTMRAHIGYLIHSPIRNLTKRIWQLCSFSFSHYTHLVVRRRRGISRLRATMHLSYSHQMLSKKVSWPILFFWIIALNNTICTFFLYELYP